MGPYKEAHNRQNPTATISVMKNAAASPRTKILEREQDCRIELKLAEEEKQEA